MPDGAGFDLLNFAASFNALERARVVGLAQRGTDLLGQVAFSPRGLGAGHAAGIEQGFDVFVARLGVTDDEDFVHGRYVLKVRRRLLR